MFFTYSKEQITYVNASDPQTPGAQACKHPLLDVNAKEIMHFIQPATPIVCTNIPDWVTVHDIIRLTDDNNKNGITTRTHTEYELTGSDYVRVSCTGDGNTRWRGILSGVRNDPEVSSTATWEKVQDHGLPLNVLIWGHDSLSRNMFMRKLPKTYHFMKESLEALVLEGYNIVGDGTPQALIPILTGKTEVELPQTRKRMGNEAKHVNIYPFVWNDYKKAGYITVYPDKPKFMFSFHSELSHDSFNQIGAADEDLTDFFRWMRREGHLNNTLLIVMSDHGHRTNTKRLTTPFDIHPTLKAVLNFPPTNGKSLGKGDIRNRSISLFSEVPRERTCVDAGIEPHWCACLAWHELKSGEDPLAMRAAEALVDSMNKETEITRDLCAPLHLSSLQWAGRFQPHTSLLQFKKNADIDGFKPDLSENKNPAWSWTLRGLSAL
ncbi:hypothetical protein B566_EDAN001780 [Ephemera danica]|nr:hypothetical protein B566_EDAN001780 [Ephemera danica]